jgi:transposase-like protein
MKKKNYTQEFREQIIKEVQNVKDIGVVARKHEIARSTINGWLKKQNSSAALIEGKEVTKELKEKEQENDQLKKLLGEKDLEIAILRDLLKKVNPQLKIK